MICNHCAYEVVKMYVIIWVERGRYLLIYEKLSTK